MKARSRPMALVVGILLVASGGTAAAQDAAAAADVLFNQARVLTEKGDFAAACPKFEESERLDPGMGTLYRLGDCYEHLGRTASAWASFHEVMIQARSAGQAAREADAGNRAAALEKLLSHLTIEVPASSGAGVVIERDGVQVGAAQWGLSIPVDPGAHALVAHAPRKIEWRATVAVGARESVIAKVPPLADAPEPPRAAASEPPSATRRTAGLATFGVGVGALGVSGVFGLISMGHKSDVDKNCDATNGCNQTGANASRSAVHTGNVATGFFVGGAVLAAGGLALYLTAPRATSSSAVSPHIKLSAALGGGMLEGSF